MNKSRDKTILIDYLNFYTILYIIFNKYEAVYIFSKHIFLENFYRRLLSFFDISLKNLSIEYSSKDTSNYSEIVKEKIALSDQFCFENELLQDFLYKGFFYQKIHPIVELKVFFGSINFDKILINYANYFYLLENKESFYKKIKYYRLPLLASSEGKFFFYRKIYFDQIYFFLRSYIVSVIKIFRFSLTTKKISEAEILIATDKKKSFVYDNFHEFKKSKIDYIVFDPTSLSIYSTKNQNHLYSLHFKEFFQSIKEIYRIQKSFLGNRNVKLSLYLYLLENAKNIFFLRRILTKTRVKIIYSCYEGSFLVDLLSILGYVSSNIISLRSMWSLGSLPQQDADLYKQCDIFFSWGKRQNDSYVKCKGTFRFLVTVGYVGDYSINQIRHKSSLPIKNFKDKGLKVVAVYDNVTASDHFTTPIQLNNFYRGVLELLKDGSYACVIKTKHGIERNIEKRLYNEIFHFNDKITLDFDKANLMPAFEADYTYVFSLNSLGCVASVWGNKCIHYDEAYFINNNEVPKNSFIINEYVDLIPRIKSIGNINCSIDRDSLIDPFVDGNAQYRIVEYVKLLLGNSKSKLNKIEDSNVIYRKKYGFDKVFSTNQSNNR